MWRFGLRGAAFLAVVMQLIRRITLLRRRIFRVICRTGLRRRIMYMDRCPVPRYCCFICLYIE
eukprot:FN602001.1.p2 GENE.FN602001.1~~FN602001.1.p2  ORF type:complete len:63 (+),score=6.37 FN602001.1:85-273(+)